MAKPITIANTFNTQAGPIPLSQLDANFSNVATVINDPATYQNYAVDTGTANVMAVAPNPAWTAYTAGTQIQVKAANANTAATTLNVSTLGAKSCVNQDGSALSPGQLQANGVYSFIYDGTNFELQSPNLYPTQKQNYCFNSGCRVIQRQPTGFPAVNTDVYGQVDGFRVGTSGAATISAGTIQQGSVSGTSTGKTCQFAGVTTTGAGTLIVFKQRLESKDVIELNAKTILIQAQVYQDTGAAINWTITINKANSADNFSAVTQAAASGNQSVNTATLTQISFSATLGAADASNGLEIVIAAAAGAVTTKNFHVADLGLYKGAVTQVYALKPFAEEFLKCARYLPAFQSDSTVAYVAVGGNFDSTSTGYVFVPFKTPPRVSPTAATPSTVSDFTLLEPGGATSAVTIFTFSSASQSGCLLHATGTGAPYTAHQMAAMYCTNATTGFLLFTGAEL